MCMGCVAYDDLQIHRLGQKITAVSKYRAARATNLSEKEKKK